MKTRPNNKKRAAALSMPPLALIAVAFFLPTVEACSEMISPAGFVGDEPLAGFWVVPPYLVGAVFLLLTGFILFRRREPSGLQEGVAIAGLVAGFSSLLIQMGSHIYEGLGDTYAIAGLAWMFLAGTVASMALVSALKQRGWHRWDGLLASYAALATSLLPLYVSALAERDLLFGGFIYTASVLAVAVLRVPRVQRLLGPKHRPAPGPYSPAYRARG